MRGDDIAVSTPSPMDEQDEEYYAADEEFSSSTKSPNSDYQRLVEATAAVDLTANHVTPPINTPRAVDSVSYSGRVIGVPGVRMGESSGGATSMTATAPGTFFGSASSQSMSLLNDDDDRDTGYGTSGSLEMNLGSATSTDNESSEDGAQANWEAQPPSVMPEYRTSHAEEKPVIAPPVVRVRSRGGGGPWRTDSARRTPRIAPDAFPYPPRAARNRLARGGVRGSNNEGRAPSAS